MSSTLEVYHPERSRPVLVLADHAGRVVPDGIDLGIARAELDRHIAYDIGAAVAARRLADMLDAPALLCRVSRLVIDPNRRPRLASSMPLISDGTVIPGNRDLDEARILARIRGHFLPYHRAIARWIGGRVRTGIAPAIIAVHSFTPLMLGQSRPWQVGILWRGDQRLSAPLLEGLRRDPTLTVGDNQPYSGVEDFGYTVNFHAQRNGLPHVMIELRQDQIDQDERAIGWADRLAALLAPPLADPGLYRRHGEDNRRGLDIGLSWRDLSSRSASAR